MLDRFNARRRSRGPRLHIHKLYVNGWGDMLIDPTCPCPDGHVRVLPTIDVPLGPREDREKGTGR